MLSVKNLEVVYDDVILVLRGFSIDVPPGKIVALLGANGAGKTTLLRAISGLLDIHEGEITKGQRHRIATLLEGPEPVALDLRLCSRRYGGGKRCHEHCGDGRDAQSQSWPRTPHRALRSFEAAALAGRPCGPAPPRLARTV